MTKEEQIKKSEKKKEQIKKREKKNLKNIVKEKPSHYLKETESYKYIVSTKEWGKTLKNKISSHDLYLVKLGEASVIRLSDLREMICCTTGPERHETSLVWREIDK